MATERSRGLDPGATEPSAGPGSASAIDAIARAIERAAARREAAGVAAAASGYRLVHDEWDSAPGLVIERLGDFALVRYRDPSWAGAAAVDAIEAGLRAVGLAGARWVFDAPAKDRTDAGTERDEAIEATLQARGFATPREPFPIREYERSYRVSTRSGFSCGLFFDMRECRRELALRWSGRRVLNLFAYTCGFGVALSPHNEVVNVDTSGAALDHGRDNYRLNSFEPAEGAFVKRDAFDWLHVAARVGNRFDAVVLDPPSYSAGKKARRGGARRFSLDDDLDELLALALGVLEPGGEAFVATNSESIDRERFARRVAAAAGRRSLAIRHEWPPAADYPVPSSCYHLKTALLA